MCIYGVENVSTFVMRVHATLILTQNDSLEVNRFASLATFQWTSHDISIASLLDASPYVFELVFFHNEIEMDNAHMVGEIDLCALETMA
jgi:hypothetical protein